MKFNAALSQKCILFSVLLLCTAATAQESLPDAPTPAALNLAPPRLAAFIKSPKSDWLLSNPNVPPAPPKIRWHFDLLDGRFCSPLNTATDFNKIF